MDNILTLSEQIPIFEGFLKASSEMINNSLVIWFSWVWIIDILTGLAKSLLGKTSVKIDSSIGLKGLLKHAVVVIIVFTSYPFLIALNFSSVSSALITFYSCIYSLSIIENLNIMGIPFPKFITENLEKLKEKSENTTKSNDS